MIQQRVVSMVLDALQWREVSQTYLQGSRGLVSEALAAGVGHSDRCNSCGGESKEKYVVVEEGYFVSLLVQYLEVAPVLLIYLFVGVMGPWRAYVSARGRCKDALAMTQVGSRVSLSRHHDAGTSRSNERETASFGRPHTDVNTPSNGHSHHIFWLSTQQRNLQEP